MKSLSCGYHFNSCSHLGNVEQDKTHYPHGTERYFWASGMEDLGLLISASQLLCSGLPRVAGIFFSLISETTDYFTIELSEIMCGIPLNSFSENWLVYYIDVLNKTAVLSNCTLCCRDGQWLSCNWYEFL